MTAIDELRLKRALEIRCPSCGADPGQQCRIQTGLPFGLPFQRSVLLEPHRDRILEATRPEQQKAFLKERRG